MNLEMRSVPYFLFIVLFSLPVRAQTIESPLDTLYSGGSDNYKAIVYSSKSVFGSVTESETSGFLIYEITVDSSGSVSAQIMTKLTDQLEMETTKIIRLSAKGWIPKSTTYKIYQPVLYGYSIEGLEKLNEKIQAFPDEFKFPILEPLNFYKVKYMTTNVVREIKTETSTLGVDNGTRSTDTQFSGSNLGSKTRKISGSTIADKVNDYLRTMSKYRRQKEKGKNKKAFELLSEMIRINPFDPQLIFERMELARKLSDPSFIKYDTPWLLALKRIGISQTKKP